MRKAITLMLLSIFLVTLMGVNVSSADWDNVLDYSNEDLKVTISNSFLLLFKTSEIGSIELKSHPSVNYVKKVGAGNQVVMWYDFNFLGLYENGLGDVEFTDEKTGKIIERDYSFVYWGERERDIYEDVCSKPYFCEKVFVRKETFETWLPYNSKDIPKGNIRIGLMAYVEVGDKVDGIWTITGKKVKKHAVWTEELNVDILSYWKMDGSDYRDWVAGANNGTASAGISSVAGIIGNAGDWEVGDGNDNVSVGSNTIDLADGNFTFNFWANVESYSAGDSMMFAGWTTGGFGMYMGNAGGLKFGKFGVDNIESTLSMDTGQWYMVTYKYDASADIMHYYLNGTYTDSDSYSTTFSTGIGYSIGSGMHATQSSFDGQLDEVGVWTRCLTSAELTQLYNGGTGITYTDVFDTPPTSTLNAPANLSTVTNPNVIFNATGTDNHTLQNMSLIVNGSYISTNSSPINNTPTLFPYTLPSASYYNWTVEACDNEDTCVEGTLRGITYSNDLTVSLTSPVEAYNSSSASISFNGTASDDTAIINVSLIIDDVYNETNSSGYNATYYSFTKNLADGDHNWSYQACDIYACLNATARNLTVDTTPPIVNNAENITDLVTYSLPVNSTWNYTTTDPHIDSCYYNTTEDASYNIITCNASENTTWASGGNKTIQYCANDTFGWETCNEIWVYVYSVNYTQSDDPDPVGEGVDVLFDLNVSLTSTPTITATLRLNDTYYTVDSTTSTANYYYFQKTVTIPDGYGNTTGFPQLWLWNYTIDGITTNASTTSTDLTVYALAIDNCTTYGDVILNITLNDEEGNYQVNGSVGSNIEIDLLLTSIIDPSLTWQYNRTWVNDSNVAVCIPSNILNNSEYYIDFDIGFSSTGRVWEFYFLDNGTLNSTKVFDAYTDYTISLMDLLTADSTSFLFNYFDEDGLVVEGSMVHVFRKYIGEGIFREVERAKADDNGDTILHLVEEDVIYYFVITTNSETLFTSNTYTALCQATPCSIQLEASGEFVDFTTDYDLITGGGYTVQSDAGDRMVNLTYSLDHTADMNFTLYRYESDGSYTVVDTDNDTGSSGVISLTAPQVAGNVSFFATIQKDDVFISSEWIDFESDASQFFGTTLALLLAGLIILTLGLVAVTEGAGTIIFVILGIIFAGALGLIYTQLSTGVNIIIYLVLVGGLIVWKLNRRRS